MFRLGIIAVSFLVGCLAVVSAGGNEPAPRADQVADLKDTLVAGLKVTRPEDLRWIDRVVEKVDEGRLPLPLVLSTFKWARKQHPVYPFAYFKRGLKLRAARLGIPL